MVSYVQNFDSLKKFMVTEQIKKNIPFEIKEYYLDAWEEYKTASTSAEKRDRHETFRRGT